MTAPLVCSYPHCTRIVVLGRKKCRKHLRQHREVSLRAWKFKRCQLVLPIYQVGDP